MKTSGTRFMGKIQTRIYNFYSISLMKDFNGKIKYGQKYYDFDSGAMTFFGPRQMFTIEADSTSNVRGWAVVFHPDFIQNYHLSRKIKGYSFFAYAVNETLHLSETEKGVISSIMLGLQDDIESSIDKFTQEIVISRIELFLSYCNKYYYRQFITRTQASNDLLMKFEQQLSEYFQKSDFADLGIPTTQYFAEKISISPNYLNDVLKNLTGQTTQQHILNFLIGKAKHMLCSTSLSVSEIAYRLGFEYPQSFNRLFKNKTKQTLHRSFSSVL